MADLVFRLESLGDQLSGVFKLAPELRAEMDCSLLESRVLFSSTPATELEAAESFLPETGDLPSGLPSDLEVGTLETWNGGPLDSRSQAIGQRTELVVLDALVQDADRLLDDLRFDQQSSVEFVYLDGTRDGIEQISMLLQAYENVDAIHVVSHGGDGSLQLGSSILDEVSLEHGSPRVPDASDGVGGKSYRQQIAGWQESLSDDADILFYGCDFAKSESGQSLIRTLSELTGADIAASNDVTGIAELGGDWDLEFGVGKIDAEIVFGGIAQDAWSHTLASVTVNTFDDIDDGGDTSNIANLIATPGADGISLREAIVAANNTLGGDEIILGSGTYLLQRTLATDSESTGDLDITDDLTINGAGSGLTIIDASTLANRDRVIEISNSDVDINGLTIQGGVAASGGGLKIANSADVTLTDVVVTGNTATNGGGIENDGTLTINSVVIDNNTANNAAGIENTGALTMADVVVSDNAALNEGGGIRNSSDVTASNTTFVGNSATSGGAVYSSGNIAVQMALSNVTISGNSATLEGGAIWTSRLVTATNVTIANNSAANAGGVHVQSANGDVVLLNSILFGNTATTGANSDVQLTSLGFNMSTSDAIAAVATDITDTDPLLLGLADNGGFGHTHALSSGSQAIDNGTTTNAPTTDQRGATRDLNPDIGAYEFNASGPIVTLPGVGASYTENNTAIVIDSTATVTDSDSANFNGGQLRVELTSNGEADDRLAIRNEGSGAGQIGVSGSTVSFGGTTIGTLSGGDGVNPLVVDLNSSATPTATTALIRNVTFQSLSETPSELTRTVAVDVTDGTSPISNSATTTIAVTAVNDAPGGSLSITGTPTEDQTLTVNNAITDDDGLASATFSFQWMRDGVNIAGATGTSYTLTQADVGTNITVSASYVDDLGTAEIVTSNPRVIANVNDAPNGSLTIIGTVEQNQTLTIDNLLTDEDGIGTTNYQWQRNGASITGATGTSYTLTQADVGTIITVQASYTDGQSTTEVVVSSPTTMIANVNDLPTGSIAIQGSPMKGSLLTAVDDINDPDGLGTFQFQWQRDGVNIPGANSSTLQLAEADTGSLISVVVRFVDGGGTNESLASQQIEITTIPPPPVVAVQSRLDGESEPQPDPDAQPDPELQTEAAQPPISSSHGASPKATSSLRPDAQNDEVAGKTGPQSEPVDADSVVAPLVEVVVDRQSTPQGKNEASIDSATDRVPTGYRVLTAEQSLQLDQISRPGALWQDLDRVKDEVCMTLENQTVFVGSAVTGSAGLTVGYIVWTLRSGVMLSTFLAQMPAWRIVDPLVVMAALRDEEGDDESIDAIAEGKSHRTQAILSTDRNTLTTKPTPTRPTPAKPTPAKPTEDRVEG